ncbi:MAG TPA: hypothetical protein VJW94_16480 [Candidatus Acidoferrum sp.]|nr:hypothetical protein [Candidatus Acidoferrum sp.]
MKRLSLYAALVACIVVCGCGESCDYETLSETKSPDGKLKVVVFQRGCGTPIDSSEQISILSSSASSPSGRGNAFIAGDENRAKPAGAKQTIEIIAIWESNSSLVISYPNNTQVFLKKPSVAGVAIKYKPVP